MAQRPVRVIIGSVILSLQSCWLLLLSALSGVLLVSKQALGGNELVGFAMILGVALLTAAAAIGLFRLKNWARVLTIAMSGFGLFMGVLMFVMTLAMIVIGRSGSTGKGAMSTGALAFVLLVYVVWLLLSLWWLQMLNAPLIKQAFSPGAAELHGGSRKGRPLSITAIAVLLMCGPLGFIQLWQIPGSLSWVFGWHVPVAVFRSVMVVTMVIGLCLGIGLWRLRPWARTGTIAFLIYVMLNVLLSFRMPTPTGADLQAFSAAEMKPEALAHLEASMPTLQRVMLIAVFLWFCVQLWFLVTRRHSFEHPGK